MLAAVILLIATNAALIGVSRLTYSMGQHRQLPEALRQVHPKYRTPYIAILIFAVVAIITLLPGKTEFLATMYSFGAMLSFTIAHVAVIQLRRSEKDHERTWKPPLNFRAFGFEVPTTAVLGGFGTFAAWIVVMALNPPTLVVGIGWMVLGDHDLRPLPPQPGPAADPDREGGDAGTARGRGGRVPRASWSASTTMSRSRPEMVATAVKLASNRRRGIHVHSMMTVPTNLPLDAEMPEREAEAQRQVEEAKLIGGAARDRPRRPRAARPGGLLGRRGGAEIQAAAIVVGLRYRSGVPLYDKTLQTVLGERPCRVIVVSDPLRTDPVGRRRGARRERRRQASALYRARSAASR